MSVVIVVPVLNRPSRVRPLMECVAAATRVPYRLLFVATGDDTDELAALEAAGAEFIVPFRTRQAGDYSRKINAALAATDEPVLFTGADDLVFHPGWFLAAAARLTEGIGVVGTNDLGNRDVLAGTHATHSLVTRDYAGRGTFDRPGVPAIYYEGYDHNYCDVELVETAKVREAWAFAEDSVVEHLHPSWAKAAPDTTYELGRAEWAADARLWRLRRRQIIRFTRTLRGRPAVSR